MINRYFSYLLSSRRKLWFILFALITAGILVLGFSIGFASYILERSTYTYTYKTTLNTNILRVFLLVLYILCFIEPAIMFSFKMKRNSLEKEMALPLSNRLVFVVRYVIGYLEIIIPYVLASLLSLIIILANVGAMHLFPMLLLVIVLYSMLGVIPYSFFTFFYLQANNILDGFIIMALAFVAPMLLGNAFICLIMAARNGGFFTGFAYELYPFTALDWINVLVINIISSTYTMNVSSWVYAGISLAYSLVTIVGVLLMKDRLKAEKANQKTTSWFGYKSLIPITFVSLMFIKGFIGMPLYYFVGPMVILLTYLSYALYYRRFFFELDQWKVFGGYAAIEAVLYIVLCIV